MALDPHSWRLQGRNVNILQCNAGLKISADDILKYFFLFLLENRIQHFMQVVSLHEVSDPIF